MDTLKKWVEQLKALRDGTAAELRPLSRERRIEMVKDRVAQHDVALVLYDFEMDGRQGISHLIIKGNALLGSMEEGSGSMEEGSDPLSAYVIPAHNVLDACGLLKHLGIDESSVGNPVVILKKTHH
jgi:hypothetical protein